jgi:hypothetical protein
MRMVVCGQTMAHLPQSMQMSGSQMGISLAMARFSYLAVPVGKVADGQAVAVAGHEQARHLLHELRRLVGDGGRHALVAGDLAERDVDQPLQRTVDSGEVAVDDGLAPAGVGLLHRRLDVGDGLVGREHAGELEEARLHHRVDAVAHLRLTGHRVGVDRPQVDLLVDQLLLDLGG